MFSVHNERPNLPLNQAQTEEFDAFCKALAEFKVDDASRRYYADPDPFRDREIPLEWLIKNLQKTLEAIEPSTLEIIARLEKTQPLKLQLQESLMVLSKVFFQLKYEKQWAIDYQNIIFSEEQKENLNRAHDTWMPGQIGCYFTNVKTFESRYLSDIKRMEAFVRFIRDFFPKPEEYHDLFTVFRQERYSIFWDNNRCVLQESLYRLLRSAFIVEGWPVPVPQLPPSVIQVPVRSAREIMPPPPARPKRFPLQPVCASALPPQPLQPVCVSALPPQPLQPVCVLESSVRVPLQSLSWAYPSGNRPHIAPESLERPTAAGLEEVGSTPPQCVKRPYHDGDIPPAAPNKRARVSS